MLFSPSIFLYMLSTRLRLQLGVFCCFVSCFTQIVPFYFSFLSAVLALSLCHAATALAISVQEVFEDGRLNLYEQFAGSNGESVTAVISQLRLFIYNGACSQTGLCAIECSNLLSHLFQNRTNLSLEAPVF